MDPQVKTAYAIREVETSTNELWKDFFYSYNKKTIFLISYHYFLYDWCLALSSSLYNGTFAVDNDITMI